MAETDVRTDPPIPKQKPVLKKPGKMRYIVDRKNFLAKVAMTGLKELYISGGSLPQEQVDALYSALPGCQITVEGVTP